MAYVNNFQAITKASPLSNYNKAVTQGPPQDPNRFDASKPFAFSPEYTAAQKSREDALKAQFGAAQRGLQQKEAQTKDEIGTGLNRLTARVGAVGGSVERAREKAVNETSREYAGQYQDLAANEAGALSQLKGEDAARMFESEQNAKQLGMQQQQFDIAKDQFAQQMSFNYKELDENLKTNMLNAITTMKKAGINTKNLSKIFESLQGIYGANRTSSFKPLVAQYLTDEQKNKEYMQSHSAPFGSYGTM